ncbi:MAG: type I glyceraldehyde-3-phosphate dehydrogenase [Thermoanaerobaculia bacterium]
METIRVGINGFGRIGRCTFKQLFSDDRFEVVGLNDLADPEDLAYLLKYDSVHGWYPEKVSAGDSGLRVGEHRIPFFSADSPAEIPWGDVGADVVIESSGVFRGRAEAAGHLEAGAGRVIISAPSKDADATFVPGVNHDVFDPDRHRVVSLASCTTNCLAPVAKVLDDTFEVETLLMTTVHAYTASQTLMDKPMRHRRRGRAAAVSIIPTTTGAAKATEKVIPALEGKMDGMAMRVPVVDGSITDAVATLGREVTVEQVHDAFREAASRPPLQGILRVSNQALVSRDIIGDTHSSVVSARDTMAVGRMVKILAWYDNEWGYSARLKDFARFVAERTAEVTA